MRAPSSVFSWPYLQQLLVANPQPYEWWWIFALWIKALLHGGKESLAHLVCVGYHVCSETQRGVDVSRTWHHFLPEDCDSSALHRLRCYVGHALQNEEQDRAHLMRTTQLLELVVAQRSDLCLKPLFVTLDPDDGSQLVTHIHKLGRDSSLLAIDWSPLRTAIAERPMGDTCLHGQVDAVPGPPKSNWQQLDLTVSTGAPVTSEAITQFTRQLVGAGYELRPHDFSILGPMAAHAAPGHFVQLGEDDENRLRSFAWWIHRAAPADAWSHLLTVPLWLPPVIDGARDGSLIVYLRKGAVEAPSAEGALRRVLSYVTAALPGAAFMPYERLRGIESASEFRVVEEFCESKFAKDSELVGLFTKVHGAQYVCMRTESGGSAQLLPKMTARAWTVLMFLLERCGEEFTPNELAAATGQRWRKVRGGIDREKVAEVRASGLECQGSQELAKRKTIFGKVRREARAEFDEWISKAMRGTARELCEELAGAAWMIESVSGKWRLEVEGALRSLRGVLDGVGQCDSPAARSAASRLCEAYASGRANSEAGLEDQRRGGRDRKPEQPLRSWLKTFEAHSHGDEVLEALYGHLAKGLSYNSSTKSMRVHGRICYRSVGDRSLRFEPYVGVRCRH
jgi:hypothetical protein